MSTIAAISTPNAIGGISVIRISGPKSIKIAEKLFKSLNDIIVSAKYILKNKGSLYIVHRPERFMELVNLLQQYKFAIKKIQFVYSDFKKPAIMVLIKATKNGSDGVIINPPINIVNYKTYKNIFE